MIYIVDSENTGPKQEEFEITMDALQQKGVVKQYNNLERLSSSDLNEVAWKNNTRFPCDCKTIEDISIDDYLEDYCLEDIITVMIDRVNTLEDINSIFIQLAPLVKTQKELIELYKRNK